MRITNVNTLSALIDRLITERIKEYFFIKEKDIDNEHHQAGICALLKLEIEELLIEAIDRKKYEFVGEKRTFKPANDLIENIDRLIRNDIHIGESDRVRLTETESDSPDVNVFILQERRLRQSNEGRSHNKNLIDQNLEKIIYEI